MDLKEEDILGQRANQHWYYRAKLDALIRATADLPVGRVLDVGAGSGFFSRGLLAAGRATAAICVDPFYADVREETVAGAPLLFCRTLAEGGVDTSLMLMMDVLEHVPDDVLLAREYVERIPSGARVIVTVPAFKWLWSGHDVFLEHYRRYTLPEMEGVLRSAGLLIEFGSYYYGAILPVAAALRLGKRLVSGHRQKAKSDMQQFSPVLNAMFWAVCRAELQFLRANRIAGLSVIVRAVKP